MQYIWFLSLLLYYVSIFFLEVLGSKLRTIGIIVVLLEGSVFRYIVACNYREHVYVCVCVYYRMFLSRTRRTCYYTTYSK